jgi:hypothetical protein
MKSERWIIIGLIGIVLAFGLSGCIISASPDPNQIIKMKPGDKVLFKVVGPVNTPTTKCVWTIGKKDLDLDFTEEVVSEGKNEFELDLNGDTRLTNKVNIITCKYMSYQYRRRCGPMCYWGWGWDTTDLKNWEVKVNPDSDTIITGDYIIEDSADLHSINGYTIVTGSLIIGPNIENLEGLDKLTTIGGDLGISWNDYIKNLTAFKSITSIRGLYIHGDDALTSLTGLENITSFSGDLYIGHNDALTNLSGLENMTSIGKDLEIEGNPALTSLIGLENLASVGESLYIDYNDTLTNLSCLENLKSVGEGLRISDNAELTSLSGLENITSFGGGLYIQYNNLLTDLSGLENITLIGGDLHIGPKNALTSLSGLDNIKSIGGGLSITSNDALTSLSALENLISVGGILVIYNNQDLTSLGMTGLQKIGGYFDISYNPLLCKSLAEELRDQVHAREGIGGLITIEGNKVCSTP